MKVPRVTLVLPVHNGAAFLAQALASIFSQTFTDFELICVDDGSTDATPDILAGAAQDDRRVRIVTHDIRRGLPASLNTGFAIARGDLHGWVSDDNRMRPEMLERLVGALDDSPAAAIVYAGYTEIDAEGKAIARHAARPSGDLLLANLVGPAFLYRAEVFEALEGYDEALEGVEDYDFWLRARHLFKFAPLTDDLLEYRVHPQSLSHRQGAQIARRHDILLRREIPLEPGAPRRALAWLALATERVEARRIGLVARVFAEHPPTALRASRRIARWLRGTLAGSAGPP